MRPYIQGMRATPALGRIYECGIEVQFVDVVPVVERAF